jgi:hypothetical protein
MPFGLDDSWVAAPPDVAGAGDAAFANSGVFAHPAVGGDSWGSDGTGTQPDSGFSRLVTDDSHGAMTADAKTRAQLDDWRDLFNWRHSPTPWIVLGVLVAVGFINLRVNTRVGPAHGDFGIG